MINKDIVKLKNSINEADDISAERKQEINCLLNEVLEKLPEAKEKELTESSERMKHLVAEFEVNNPELADLINRISLMLSNIGV